MDKADATDAARENLARPPTENPVLMNSPFFTDMSGLEYNAATAFMERRKIRKGDAVFRQGDMGEEMFILLEGSLSAFRSQSDGTQRRIFDVGLGHFFGEMSIIANEPRSATIRANAASDVMVIQRADFYRIIFEFPMLGIKILNSIIALQNVWLGQSSQHLGDLMRWGETARRRAITDELTGLYNRRFLEDSIKDHFDHDSAGIRKAALLMLDLDRVHAINERCGTLAGDLVFRAVAGVLNAQTRSGDICARLAGDEFAVFLPDTDGDYALVIAENIRGAVAGEEVMVPEKPNAVSRVPIRTRTSIGLALAPRHGGNPENLIAAADAALIRAKELGRNRVEMADGAKTQGDAGGV
ncbi:MAG: GGDEF domain-containing protein [Spirochaetia bacterium]|jgi:diguanylate cyclase (GGDEF)-like protein|nr:GGDEF domain-containing protein [Spirochaetia bacterium]